MHKLRLGVNIDHVATVRNARGSEYPDPLRAAILAEKSGADGITAHLREDRRHISDADIRRLRDAIGLPLNLEMAATDEMLQIALKTRPNACCIVPEKRRELTTEGGLDVVNGKDHLRSIVASLKDIGVRVSLFVDPDKKQLDAAKALDADIVELHTGTYAEAVEHHRKNELRLLQECAVYAHEIGLECHAGHGLTYDNVKPVAAIHEVVELNIGHFLIAEAIFVGMEQAVRKMRQLMNDARNQDLGSRIQDSVA